MNIVDVCRICLEKSSANKKTSNIFSANGNSHLPLMIMACASVQILEGDGLPTSICQICIAKLNVAFDFKQQCESSDAKLRLQFFDNSQHLQITPDLSDFSINIKEEQKPITFQTDSQIIGVNNVLIEQDRCNNDVIPQTQILIPLLKEESQQNTILQTLNNSSRNQLILEQSQEKSLTFHKSENKNFINLSNIKNDSITSRPGRKKNSNKKILSQSKNDEARVPKVHQCDTCGKTFNRREYLTQHIRIHTGEKPYYCHLCEKRFINSGHLTTHMRTHTGERPHSCSLCPKAFSTRQELHKHTMVHNGERPFICKMCGKRFGSSSNLYSHLKHHTGEKNFTCEHCGKAFYTKQELKQHFVVHTGEKAFLCECCNKRFSQIAHLRRHAKLHK